MTKKEKKAKIQSEKIKYIEERGWKYNTIYGCGWVHFKRRICDRGGVGVTSGRYVEAVWLDYAYEAERHHQLDLELKAMG